MHHFLKIRQRKCKASCPPSEQTADQLWLRFPLASPTPVTAEYSEEKFWQAYDALLSKARKLPKTPIIQKAGATKSPVSGHRPQIFRSRKTSLNLVGLLTDLIVAILVAPSSDITFLFCLVVLILHLILVLFSLPASKCIILDKEAIIIKNYWNRHQRFFLFSHIQSVSFYSREEDSDKLYIETFDMEFCVDVNIPQQKIKHLFYLLQQKGITINTTL